MQCEVERRGRIFFPDFCNLCLRFAPTDRWLLGFHLIGNFTFVPLFLGGGGEYYLILCSRYWGPIHKWCDLVRGQLVILWSFDLLICDLVYHGVRGTCDLVWWELLQEIQRIQRGEFQAGALQGGHCCSFPQHFLFLSLFLSLVHYNSYHCLPLSVT